MGSPQAPPSGVPPGVGDVELSARPSPLLPEGAFACVAAAAAAAAAESAPGGAHAGMAAEAPAHRPPARPPARAAAVGVRLGRRRRSKKKRMEAAVAGFRWGIYIYVLAPPATRCAWAGLRALCHCRGCR